MDKLPNLVKPKCKISELTGDAKRLMLDLVRLFLSDLRFADVSPVLKSMSADESEEMLIHLIDSGVIKIHYSQDEEIFKFLIYDLRIMDYRLIGDREV